MCAVYFKKESSQSKEVFSWSFILSKKFGEGNGPNKKEAQQKAALFACKKLNLC